jgi:hypothetical protein
VVFRAVREEERVHVVDVGQERGGFAGGLGCWEGFAVGGGVAPGGAEFWVRVEGGAEVRGFEDGGVRGGRISAIIRREIPRLRVRAARLRRSGSSKRGRFARNDIV